MAGTTYSRLINALTVLTPEGRLYEVDMRLRPSGSAGPIASSLAAFRLKAYDEAVERFQAAGPLGGKSATVPLAVSMT